MLANSVTFSYLSDWNDSGCSRGRQSTHTAARSSGHTNDSRAYTVQDLSSIDPRYESGVETERWSSPLPTAFSECADCCVDLSQKCSHASSAADAALAKHVRESLLFCSDSVSDRISAASSAGAPDMVSMVVERLRVHLRRDESRLFCLSTQCEQALHQSDCLLRFLAECSYSLPAD